MIRIEDDRTGRHYCLEYSLALQQRQFSKIFAVQPQDVERDELLRGPATEQGIELRLAFGVVVNDLTIEDRILVMETSGQGVAECGEGLVDVCFAGDKANVPILNVCQRPETVVLIFEQPVGVAERLKPVP